VSLFLVDDTDGRIVAELETLEEAIEAMEFLAQNPETANLCIVEFGDNGGSLALVQSSTALRVLP
jgi:hypothetical protein